MPLKGLAKPVEFSGESNGMDRDSDVKRGRFSIEQICGILKQVELKAPIAELRK